MPNTSAGYGLGASTWLGVTIDSIRLAPGTVSGSCTFVVLMETSGSRRTVPVGVLREEGAELAEVLTRTQLSPELSPGPASPLPVPPGVQVERLRITRRCEGTLYAVADFTGAGGHSEVDCRAVDGLRLAAVHGARITVHERLLAGPAGFGSEGWRELPAIFSRVGA
ncbi:hypothetical protein BIV57_12720 [Mangrovactinospora gilvigrisea]|uniref:BFN domain-containing protein n=1 Tax=Mangrovactinospora gilvigrisea TaxID=1428644 RepID=A0A1J7BUF6_9ACTN|nr:bifunctional nuclease domain-containing protein [Mangrovactinospora gilvigrisea]OIV37097.1 hypothetical protein BIV57_12720 [Mangrovactinospora gilvigrisea]